MKGSWSACVSGGGVGIGLTLGGMPTAGQQAAQALHLPAPEVTLP